MHILFNILFIGIIFLVTMGGFLNKLFGAFVTFLMTLLAAIIALDFYEALANLTIRVFKWSDSALAAFMYPVFLILLFVVSYLIMRTFAVRKLTKYEVYFPKVIDSIGGIVFGVFTGFIVSGMIMILYFSLMFGSSGLAGDSSMNQFFRTDTILTKNFNYLAGKLNPEAPEFNPEDHYNVTFSNLPAAPANAREQSPMEHGQAYTVVQMDSL